MYESFKLLRFVYLSYLQDTSCLKSLNLMGNDIEAEGAMHIAKGLHVRGFNTIVIALFYMMSDFLYFDSI